MFTFTILTVSYISASRAEICSQNQNQESTITKHCQQERCHRKTADWSAQALQGEVSKLVFYAQSTGAVISGRYTSHIVYLIFNNVYVLKWVYIQF